MSDTTANGSGIIVACPTCNQRNRIPYNRLGAAGPAAQCGKCRRELKIEQPVEVESEAAFDKLMAGPLPVVVDFWAPWCGPCRAVAPEFSKVAAKASGRFLVAKVNTEALPSLGARFQISSIPSMVVFYDGRESGRSVGARPAAAIEAFVRSAIS